MKYLEQQRPVAMGMSDSMPLLEKEPHTLHLKEP